MSTVDQSAPGLVGATKLGEFSHCECSSHKDQDGVVTHRPQPINAQDSWPASRATRMAQRTREAKSDIAAARAMPTDVELEVQISDAALAETPAVREMGGATDTREALERAGAVQEQRVGIAAAMQDVDRAVDQAVRELRDAPSMFRSERDLGPLPRLDQVTGVPVRGEVPPLPPDAIILTGFDADRYRAMQAAARAAQEATQAVQATGIALRDAFQAFCAGVVSAKEP